jgi:hypothetical protein
MTMEEQNKKQSIEGIAYHLYWAYDENTETWRHSSETAIGQDIDSCVHRYGHEVGFIDPDNDIDNSSDDEEEEDERLRITMERELHTPHNEDSSKQRIESTCKAILSVLY